MLNTINNYCPSCRSITQHDSVNNYLKEKINEDSNETQIVIHTYQCVQCKSPQLFEYELQLERKAYSIEEKYFFDYQLYPFRSDKKFKNIPSNIQKSYKEALNCFDIKSYDACAIMVRKAIEAICTDKGVTNGNLSKKLKKLLDNRLIDQRLYDWAELLRFLGNEGAHGFGEQSINKTKAKDAIEFLEAMLYFDYDLIKKFEVVKKKYSHN